MRLPERRDIPASHLASIVNHEELSPLRQLRRHKLELYAASLLFVFNNLTTRLDELLGHIRLACLSQVVFPPVFVRASRLRADGTRHFPRCSSPTPRLECVLVFGGGPLPCFIFIFLVVCSACTSRPTIWKMKPLGVGKDREDDTAEKQGGFTSMMTTAEEKSFQVLVWY